MTHIMICPYDIQLFSNISIIIFRNNQKQHNSELVNHLPVVAHLYASVISDSFGSGNGLLPLRRQAII